MSPQLQQVDESWQILGGGLLSGRLLSGKDFLLRAQPQAELGTCRVPPYGILGDAPKDRAADMLPSSLAPLQLCGSSRAAHRVPAVTQLATAQSKTNDLH